jgi:D-alanyl-D-alanine carboxypeptidase
LNAKHTSYYLIGIAVIGIITFTACESDDNLPANTPTASDTVQPTDTSSTPDKDVWTELSVAPSSLHLAPGSAHALQVTAKRNGKLVTIKNDNRLTYHSSSEQVVTVSADGLLQTSAEALSGSHAIVQVNYGELKAEVQVYVFASMQATLQTEPDNSIPVVTNPLDIAVLVNKTRALPANFAPTDLVYVDVPFSSKEKSDKQMLRVEAARALEKLFARAQEDGIQLVAVSGYRSYATQKTLFQYNVKTQGEEVASRFVARPGLSEHQTGLSIDVSSASNQYQLTGQFENTSEGKWLAQHAAEFGFIIRYPNHKESFTGYAYEPWHIRYVGFPLSQEIVQSDLTFEQYYEQFQSVTTTP